MGCDIHVFLEVRFPMGSRWHLLARDVLVMRDYTLFGLMAGVRLEDAALAPVVPPRGLPGDLSEAVAAAAAEWGSEGHTHSYLSFPELAEAQRRYGRHHIDEDATQAAMPPPAGGDPQPTGAPAGPRAGPYEPAVRVGGFDLQAILAYLGFYERAGLTTRMVFWFDG